MFKRSAKPSFQEGALRLMDQHSNDINKQGASIKTLARYLLQLQREVSALPVNAELVEGINAQFANLYAVIEEIQQRQITEQEYTQIFTLVLSRLNAIEQKIGIQSPDDSNVVVQEFTEKSYGYPPPPPIALPQKSFLTSDKTGRTSGVRATPPVNTPVAKPPVSNTPVDLEELHILMRENWTQKQLEEHFGKSEYVIHEAKRRVRKQWFDV